MDSHITESILIDLQFFIANTISLLNFNCQQPIGLDLKSSLQQIALLQHLVQLQSMAHSF